MKTSLTPTKLTVLGSLLMATPALAFPTSTVFDDLAHCDPLAGPNQVDELGFAPPFPASCTIDAFSAPTQLKACPADVPGIANVLVRMVNLTGRTFSDVWYVGEVGTGFSNFDGTVNGMEAFRIDAVGINTPLFSESTPNGLFEPGETWEFIIDDWGNGSGFLPEDFLSIGVPSGGGVSSGSIIALEVPGPGAVSLLAASGLAMVRRRR